MPATRDAVAREAREWIGTVWRHQGFQKQVGSDCIGLVHGVGVRSGAFSVDENAPDVKPYRGYGRQPQPAVMRRALTHFFVPIKTREAKVGDILWFRVGKNPMHLGIITEPGVIVHADVLMGRVVEHGMDAGWASRIVAAFRFPEIID